MNRRVGVIGGGQLAWMMADPAKLLGCDLIIQTPHQDDPAVKIATKVIYGAIEDLNSTKILANSADVITFENEFVNLQGLATLEQQGVKFYPTLKSLSPLLDKYDQMSYFASLGLPVPKFNKIDHWSDFPENLHFPLVLKSRRHGYDGQGTFVIKNKHDLEALYNRLQNTPLILQDFIPFTKELAIIASRSVTGETAIYPVVETLQLSQVCRRVEAPALIPEAIAQQIQDIALCLLEKLDFIGVLAIELFLTPDNQVLINEIAPRTHNSGHYTIDACLTSQFEMQLRSITGLPLGDPALKCIGAVMVNLLGYENAFDDYAQKRSQLAQLKNAYVHWYGKSESRLGRKLGHVTVLLQTNNQDPEAIAQEIEAIWYPK